MPSIISSTSFIYAFKRNDVLKILQFFYKNAILTLGGE